ncbi:MAG: asparagine synthase-related protein [Longimicrobiales bacterium]
MANLLIVIDEDRHRRDLVLRSAMRRADPLAALTQGRCEVADFSAVWSAAADAPVSASGDAFGAAILWGDARAPECDDRLDAGALRSFWRSDGPAPLDGFHAGVVYDAATGSATVGTDLFGLFPIYYAVMRAVALVATSPELLLLHPLLRREVDPFALAGLLMTERLVAGHTLTAGVRRLAAGHLLRLERGREPREIVQYRFRVSEVTPASLEERARSVDLAFERAVRRHIHDAPVGTTLLSGGRDSRMIAGYLVEAGLRPRAITFGSPADHDARCARGVARELRLEHRIEDYDLTAYERYADLEVRSQHAQNGFGSLYAWGMAEHLSEQGGRVSAGYFLDTVISPLVFVGVENDYATVRASHLSRGLPLGLLRRLLRPDAFGEAIDQVEACLRSTWEAYAEEGAVRTWYQYLYDRTRFQVGSIPWRMSFGSWPVLPALDIAFLGVAGGLPIHEVTGRRLQDALIRNRFPRLARLPVAGPGDVTPALAPRLRDRAVAALESSPAGAVLRGGRERFRSRERRYYYRINDFNGPGWQRIRARAEPLRSRVGDLFDLGVLHQVLPPPAVDVRFGDALLDSSGVRNLVGVILWAGLCR